MKLKIKGNQWGANLSKPAAQTVDSYPTGWIVLTPHLNMIGVSLCFNMDYKKQDRLSNIVIAKSHS